MDTHAREPAGKWYSGVTPYQWLVLVIASLGWVFDTFEGQIFTITRDQMLVDILAVKPTDPVIRRYGDLLLAVFLLGGTLGGIIFGSLADRWGRRPTMVVTILCYSIFSGLTYFATSLWQVALLRFFVAFGVGGEWAVAAALVAEVFPQRARAHASGIFHATSILGTWLAAGAGAIVGANWRFAYIIGVAPALLILWVRASVEEPERWSRAKGEAAAGEGQRLGSLRDLFADPVYRKRAILGILLASVGLGGFWGVTVAGQDLAKDFLVRHGVSQNVAIERAKIAYGFVQTAGGGLGLLAFGPLCMRIGRRGAFAFFHIAAVAIVPITCYVPTTYTQLLIALPFYGFFTLGMHAGYAIYFPELFPTRFRGTGTGLCFNGGRIVSASMLILSGWLKSQPGMDLRWALVLLSQVFALGLVVIFFMPETKGQTLED